MKLYNFFVTILIFLSSSYHSQVKISEVYFDSYFNEVYNNGEHHYGEFIEFYNRSDQEIDISGWKLNDNYASFIFPSGTIIKGKDYLILANGVTSNSTYINNFPTLYPQASGHENQIIYQTNILLGNDEDFLILKDETGKVVDDIHYKTIPNSQYGINITTSACFNSNINNISAAAIPSPDLVISPENSLSLQRSNFDTNSIVQEEATPFGLNFTDNVDTNNTSPSFSNENYIYTRIYLEPTILSDNSKKQLQGITYFDGLGRPKQNIAIKANPKENDLVTPIEYDVYGRNIKSILPVPTESKNGEIQSGITETSANTFYNVTNAYYEKVLDDSPLNRIVQSAYPGDDWMKNSGHTVRYLYQTNTSQDKVKKYETSTTWDSINKIYISDVSQDTYYSDNTLYKYIVTDENNNINIIFKDLSGKIVLIRKNDGINNIDTYYVYNEYNNIAFIIPPLVELETTLDQPKLDLLCYQYRYDNKNRLVEKKLPNRGWEYYVYDLQGRLVATQNVNLKNATAGNSFLPGNQWLFTKYDKFGRQLYSGLKNNYNKTRADYQSEVDANGSNNEENDATGFDNSDLKIYYSKDKAYPSIDISDEVLTVNYYDIYPPDTPTVLPTVVLGQNILSSDLSLSKNTKTLSTASYTKIIGENIWDKTYVLYDNKSRPVYTHNINYKGGYTKVETELDFSSTPVRINTYHKRLSTDPSDIIIKERFEYDSSKRLKKYFHKVGNQEEVLLSDLSYNEIGQLVINKVGDNLQTINYNYNIRGWLKSINDPNNLNDDLFGLILRYNEPVQEEKPSSAYINDKVVPKYNGNISEVDWKTAYASNEPLRRYGYIYDGLDRLKSAYYNNYSNPKKDEFFEKLTYDLNGNISTLKRSKEYNITVSNVIDDLSYTYSGNQLLKIKDNQNNLEGYGSYDDVNSISYDDNGNMTSQFARKISSIKYNILDLPTTASSTGKTGGTAIFKYLADGTKVSKSYKSGTNPSIVTEYLDGFQYQNNMLQFFPTAEGYYDFTNNRYVYQYKDQVGNVRVSYYKDANNIAVIDKETNYYPLGLEHSYNPTTPANGRYKYTFQGQEKQEIGDWLSFKWRNYDPTIGRFFNVDPLSEKYAYQSHYNFSENRLIDGIELEGLEHFDTKEEAEKFSDKVNNHNVSIEKDENGDGVERIVNIDNVDLKSKAKSAMPDLAMDENDGFGWDDAGRTVLNFVPVIGSGLDIYEGARDGNWVQFGIGLGGLALDVTTLGTVTIAKGAAKTMAEEGLQIIVKEGAKEVAEEGGELAVKEVSAEGAVWAQKSFSKNFSSSGLFSGKTVDEVADALRNGSISVKDVPIDVIVRDGQTFILNTRSSAALTKAGISRNAWNVVNRTGQAAFEKRLSNQLIKNGIPKGINTIKSGNTILKH